jgi:CRISPR system Cascade subunit CasD
MTVILRLAGIMAAWAGAGAAEIRSSARTPPRSAVEGLLRAAKGLERGVNWDELGTLKMQVLELNQGIRMWDFSTQANVISANQKTTHEQTITQREFIANVDVLVGLEGDEETCEEIERVLETPVYFLSLGRRDCVPSQPIFYSRSQQSLTDALHQAADEIKRGEHAPEQINPESK